LHHRASEGSVESISEPPVWRTDSVVGGEQSAESGGLRPLERRGIGAPTGKRVARFQRLGKPGDERTRRHLERVVHSKKGARIDLRILAYRFRQGAFGLLEGRLKFPSTCFEVGQRARLTTRMDVGSNGCWHVRPPDGAGVSNESGEHALIGLDPPEMLPKRHMRCLVLLDCMSCSAQHLSPVESSTERVRASVAT
jgi:hypothetical protein